ncbi:MAG TPA: hypothetical protein VNK82_03390 [Terriglobales bacterium]|nr:hypothetical protein [Terriglobales bacterium]
MHRGLKAQSCVVILALLIWSLAPGAVLVVLPSAGRSFDAPDYYEVAAAVGKAELDAALTAAPCALNVPLPVFQPQEIHAPLAWQGLAFDRIDARSPPSA